MRAIEPARTGHVSRDGVKVAFDLYGTGERTLVLAAALVDCAWKDMEGADPLFGPALPRAGH